ncbi:hypothetical protein WMY93_026959 [Mugilogobius chulae]|uniref:C-type lectin domain-containing protein n=1 Tax=Mugilogobius chulae TaxID=88201 RepID=A0AAW0MSL4_9GOBI
MSWKDAQSYCRQHHTDLAMIEDEAENTAVTSIASDKVWIAVKSKTQIMTMEFQSEADLSLPTIWSQLSQEISEEFMKMGITDVRVTWKNTPSKQSSLDP